MTKKKPFILPKFMLKHKATIHARQAMVAQHSMSAKQIEEQTPTLKALRKLLERPLP